MAWSRVVTIFFLFLWILLIPSSLAYHFNEQAGRVKGVLVDYRIPVVNASAIFLAGFLISLGISIITIKQKEGNNFLMALGKWGTISLVTSLVIQICLGLFQFQFQHALLGYLPWGEVSFSDPQIAKGVWFTGEVYKLPYGTTAHPNILAGFVVVAFLLVCAQRFIPVNPRLKIVLFVFTALICLLTQSLTASLSLILGMIVLASYGTKLTRVARTALLSLPILTFLFFSLPQMVTHPNPSIARRAGLQQIAIKMVVEEPFLGIGWNNYTLLQEDFGYVPSTTRFLQPLHHSFLLLIVELGFLGWALNFAINFFVMRVHSLWLPAVTAMIIIASFDHYPVTISTGRMLFLLIIGVALLHKSKPKLLVI